MIFVPNSVSVCLGENFDFMPNIFFSSMGNMVHKGRIYNKDQTLFSPFFIAWFLFSTISFIGPLVAYWFDCCCCCFFMFRKTVCTWVLRTHQALKTTNKRFDKRKWQDTCTLNELIERQATACADCCYIVYNMLKLRFRAWTRHLSINQFLFDLFVYRLYVY